MAKYHKYKTEEKSYEELLATVKTQEQIAAASIHFLRQRADILERYTKELETILARLIIFFYDETNPLLSPRRDGERAIVIMTSDKGLVGGLFSKIIDHFIDFKDDYQKVVVFGKKGEQFLLEAGIKPTSVFNGFEGFDQQQIEELRRYIFSAFTDDRLSRISILYPRFISLSLQQPILETYLPFSFATAPEGLIGQSGLPVFEPGGKKIFDWFMERYINLSLYKIIIQTKLSEFSARTVAMENAANRAEETIVDIRKRYFKERKKTLTQKQLETFSAHNLKGHIDE